MVKTIIVDDNVNKQITETGKMSERKEGKCIWIEHKDCEHGSQVEYTVPEMLEQRKVCDLCLKASIAESLSDIRSGLVRGDLVISTRTR